MHEVSEGDDLLLSYNFSNQQKIFSEASFLSSRRGEKRREEKRKKIREEKRREEKRREEKRRDPKHITLLDIYLKQIFPVLR